MTVGTAQGSIPASGGVPVTGRFPEQDLLRAERTGCAHRTSGGQTVARMPRPAGLFEPTGGSDGVIVRGRDGISVS